MIGLIPDASTATPTGKDSVADVAGPLSPLKLGLVLLPARVVIIPVDIVIFRT